MDTSHGYLPMFMCMCVCLCECVCVCVCKCKQGLYLAREDAFELESHSSATQS